MQEPFREELNQLRARSLLRQLREIGSAQGPSIELVGEHLINFASNDYLGLASHDRLREAAKNALDGFGVGAGASRLVSGTQSPHVQLERAIAKWKRVPAALTFSSGYAAAVSAPGATARSTRGSRGGRRPRRVSACVRPATTVRSGRPCRRAPASRDRRAWARSRAP